ncbi:MAG: glycosyltransferase family 4 protein [Muribaculaceae bacterium]|nr:glycosyltransferase family 4 protein [Muribaculaceae bacterium]
MKVFYDSTIFSRQAFGGISRYFVELINHMPPEVTAEMGVRASANIYLKNLRNHGRYINLSRIPDYRKLNRLINHRYDAAIMRCADYDVMHPTDYNTFMRGRNRRPYVITVHDLIAEHIHPKGTERPQKLLDMEQCIRSADAIIAISHATKADIVNMYGIPQERISVIHHGYSPAPTTQKGSPLGIGPYILYVGERGGYKNFATLLTAFKILAQKYPDLRLVCTGRPFKPHEKQTLKCAGMERKVINGLFATEQMHAVYAGAQCFVLPSLMEGFGMTILEAFAAGCPVALSHTSVMPEVAGPGGAYFNPHEPEEMASVIERVITDSAYRQTLLSAASRKLEEYSWDKCAALTTDVYRKLI